MGKELECACQWKGQSGTARVYLEAMELILRGGVKARIPIAAMETVKVRKGDLVIETGGEVLTLSPGAELAKDWAIAIATPPPSLAKKLGVASDRKAYVHGKIDDEALALALKGATVKKRIRAAIVIARIDRLDELKALMREMKKEKAALPVWAVYGKGKLTTVKDSEIRAFMRAAGYVDNKTSAVSERLTATRYAPRKA
jgi:hypothetical protein